MPHYDPPSGWVWSPAAAERVGLVRYDAAACARAVQILNLNGPELPTQRARTDPSTENAGGVDAAADHGMRRVTTGTFSPVGFVEPQSLAGTQLCQNT